MSTPPDSDTTDNKPVMIVQCKNCSSAVAVFADGRPFPSVERATAFIFAWLRGKACACRPDDNHLKGLQ